MKGKQHIALSPPEGRCFSDTHDQIDKKIKNSKPIYPFHGKIGKDLNKKELLDSHEIDSYMVILGKNISKNGVVIISHNGLSIEEAINYLNKETINQYLQKYILNGAELTVHLDGKYLKQIPYTDLIL